MLPSPELEPATADSCFVRSCLLGAGDDGEAIADAGDEACWATVSTASPDCICAMYVLGKP